MRSGLSEKVREVAVREFVEPAKRSGGEIVIPIGELQRKLRNENFPSGHIRQIVTSLEADLFARRNHLIRETPAGQPEKVTTTLRFRFAEGALMRAPATEVREEDPLLELIGVLHGALREGADEFIRHLRSERTEPSREGTE